MAAPKVIQESQNVGWVITGSQGHIVLFFSSPSGEEDSNKAKILAIEDGPNLISAHFHGPALVKGDSINEIS